MSCKASSFAVWSFIIAIARQFVPWQVTSEQVSQTHRLDEFKIAFSVLECQSERIVVTKKRKKKSYSLSSQSKRSDKILTRRRRTSQSGVKKRAQDTEGHDIQQISSATRRCCRQKERTDLPKLKNWRIEKKWLGVKVNSLSKRHRSKDRSNGRHGAQYDWP